MATKKAPATPKKAGHHEKLLAFLEVLAATVPGFVAPFISEKKARVVNAAAAEAGIVLGAINK